MRLPHGQERSIDRTHFEFVSTSTRIEYMIRSEGTLLFD